MSARKNYDATFCGKLPIHQTNSIQSHGVLIIFNKELTSLLQVSENVSSLFNKKAVELLSIPVSSILTAESLKILQEATFHGLDDKLPLTLTFITENGDEESLCLIHAIEEGYIVEAELKKFYTTPAKKFVEIYQHFKSVMQHINKCNCIDEACSVVAKELKRLTGFDKVMIYRFDEGWNGTVLAEEAAESMETYMGLTFPASDIPKPARDMYLKNPYRLIPNREYEPVKLYPVLNPASNSFISLLNADLRSVAGVHIEYLKNMNVMASMSARILYNEQLWGLIACHHREPKYLSFEECSVVEMIANIFSQKITSLQYGEGITLRHGLTTRFTKIVESILDKTSMVNAFCENSGLLKEFFNAEGVALSWEGKIETEGSTPEERDIETLVYWLKQKARNNTFHLNQLPQAFEESRAFSDKASGILALPIQPDKGNYLIAFRPELVKTISWGGNPDNVIQFEPNSTSYHPRHSFQLWQETVYHTSQKWHPEEVSAAEQLRNFLVEYTLNRLN